MRVARVETAAVFPMMVVEQMTGLTRRQIRYYEKHGLLLPARTEGGHRLYSPEDVEILLLIKSLKEQGFRNLDTIKRMLNSRLGIQPRRASRSERVMTSNSSGRPGRPADNEAARAYFERHKLIPR